MNVMLIELLVVVMNAIKEIAKKILNENVEVINTNFNYNNASIAIKEMLRQVGNPKFTDDGIIKSGVIIRHLILPNNTKNTKK